VAALGLGFLFRRTLTRWRRAACILSQGRKSDYVLSPTDPDAALMQYKKYKRGASRMGYHAHYVMDGGRARIILSALVTPAEVGCAR
jgi:hypothetical protein